MKPNPNRITKHHIWWTGSSYKQGFEQMFRNHVAYVVPATRAQQDELHANVMPPPKPSRYDMNALMISAARVPDGAKGNPYWGMVDVVRFYQNINNKDANQIRQNMARQLGFLITPQAQELELAA